MMPGGSGERQAGKSKSEPSIAQRSGTQDLCPARLEIGTIPLPEPLPWTFPCLARFFAFCAPFLSISNRVVWQLP